MAALRKRKNNYDLYEDVERIKDALIDATRDVKDKTAEKIADSFEDFKRKQSEITEEVSDYVSDRPLKSLGVSLMLGIAIGYFLHNRY